MYGKWFMLFGIRVATDGSIRNCEHEQSLTPINSNIMRMLPAQAIRPMMLQTHQPDPEEGRERIGKGHRRGISRNYVKTRTPTQIASHAQKYFLRQSNLNRKRRRSSLFDITTDSFPCLPVEEERNMEETPASTLDISSENLPVSPTPMVEETKSTRIQPEEPMEAKILKSVPVLASIPPWTAHSDHALGLSPSPLSFVSETL